MPNVKDDEYETLEFADESEWADEPVTRDDLRSATLRELHYVIQDTHIAVDQRHAVMMMAIRYAAARAAAGRCDLDYGLTSQARSRRFAALQRLVYAL